VPLAKNASIYVSELVRGRETCAQRVFSAEVNSDPCSAMLLWRSLGSRGPPSPWPSPHEAWGAGTMKQGMEKMCEVGRPAHSAAGYGKKCAQRAINVAR